MIWQIVALTAIVILVIDLGMRVYFGRKALALLEKMPPFHVEADEPQKQATPFTVTTIDNLTLRGSIYHPDELPPAGVVIFCPETSSSHWSAPRYCQGLIDSGFVVVSFDFRNQGESDSKPGYESLHWVTEHEINDLEAVIDWVQEQGSLAGLPLGILGVSRGASAALLTLNRRDDIQFLCSDSGYTNDLLISHYLERWAPLVLPRFVMKCSARFMWHIKKTLYAAIWLRGLKRNCQYVNTSAPFEKMTNRQVLLISGSKDSYVPTPIARKLQAMLGEQCYDLWVVQKAAHNCARTINPELYDAKIVQFFQQMLPQPALQPPALDVPDLTEV